ncbi:MAG: 8-amino-7-oxononanoate synthase [Verrucomicrobiales bacterium]|nr:8-amino-7-oxononanoate synthase [Verrucomicrobiales bacterium]
MSAFVAVLRQRLEELRRQGLWRELRRLDSDAGPRIECAGQRLLNFSSNDYLGLAGHPALKAAAAEAAARFGAGASASRLICGSLAPHHELETALAAFKGTEAALTFATGYAAALGAIPALVGPGDVVVLDKRAHACLVDAARLSGAQLRVFPHNDLAKLEAICQWAKDGGARAKGEGRRAKDEGRSSKDEGRSSKDEGRSSKDEGRRGEDEGRRGEGIGQVLIVTESVFSMDGDHAPLRELAALKDRFGAWLLVDEAHATGLYGPHRRGLAEALGVADRIDVQMGTLGKALGAAGGYVCGPRELIDLLVNRARSFLFSTAPVPAQAAAARAAVGLVRGPVGRERVATLQERVRQLHEGLAAQGWWNSAADVPGPGNAPNTAPPAADSAIFPLVVGEATAAVALAGALRERGVFVPAIRYPTVPRGAARLRVTVSAAHTEAEIATFLSVLAACRNAVPA